jgi:hypothetical protein
MPAGGSEDAQVVAPAAPRMEARVLEHRPDLGARPRDLLVVAPVEPGASIVSVNQPEEDPEGRALAGSIRADESGYAAASTENERSETACTEPKRLLISLISIADKDAAL